MWFKKKNSKDLYPPKDDYQRSYRQTFQGIVDKYLIHHCEDDNAKLLVYIDSENDVD